MDDLPTQLNATARAAGQPVVCTLESRRASEMQDLVRRHRGVPVSAPSMKEVPVEQNTEALSAIQKIIAGDVHVIILLTGVGTERMLDVAESRDLKQPLQNAMSRIPLCVRGPKPAAVLKRLQLPCAVKAPEPNTWRELIAAIDQSNIDVSQKTVAIQEYGASPPLLNTALHERGARVLSIPVYRWELPDDLEPLRSAIRATINGDLDIIAFTSAQQVRHILAVAEQESLADDWRTATASTLVASIGPTCSEALRDAGLAINFEASPPKMGPLIRGAIDAFRTASDDR